MSECVAIRIEKIFPLSGPGDTLETRLRKVGLRGFPDVRIYENSNFDLLDLGAAEIKTKLHTPQPTVYRTHLERVTNLARLFGRLGIDIFRLNHAYDYVAVDSEGVETSWTMLPPIVEQWNIPRHDKGGFDYSSLIGPALSDALRNKGLAINPRVLDFANESQSTVYNLINDGSHRIHAGFENGSVRILRVTNMTPGFPYYAIPQPYSSVTVIPERKETDPDLKVHVVQSPGHKDLYRLFPSGGIKSGDVRPLKKGEIIN